MTAVAAAAIHHTSVHGLLIAAALLGIAVVVLLITVLKVHPFLARIAEETTVAGHPAVIPTITGRAWVTGTAQYFLDPTDPFPEGFTL